MKKKQKKTWAEIKATKPVEEWRRINRIYNKRWAMRQQLKTCGAELLEKIHNIHIVETPGPADVLSGQVHRALHLPYAWNQEDYDHAVGVLATVEKKVKDYQKRRVAKNGVTQNAISLFLQKSGEEDAEIMAVLVQLMLGYANKIGMEKVQDLDNSLTNFVVTLLRTADGYYPDWFEKVLFDKVVQILDIQTLKVFAQRINEVITCHEDACLILGGAEIGKKDDEISF